MKDLIDVRLFGGISTLTNDETKKLKLIRKSVLMGMYNSRDQSNLQPLTLL